MVFPNEIRAIEANALRRTTEGLSGASLIGLPPIPGLTAAEVETAIRELAALYASPPPTPLASETEAGIVEHATEAEVQAGTAGNLVATAARLKAELDRRHTPPAWIAPTLLNGWINFGGASAVAGYRKTPAGEVQVKGRIKNGTTSGGTAIFSLPAGYRPAEEMDFPAIQGGNTVCRITVNTSGDALITGVTDNAFLTLAAMRFDAA